MFFSSLGLSYVNTLLAHMAVFYSPSSQISLHYILSLAHPGYGQATSLSNIKTPWSSSKPPYQTPVPDDYYVHDNVTSPQGRRASAAIVMLGASLVTVLLDRGSFFSFFPFYSAQQRFEWYHRQYEADGGSF